MAEITDVEWSNLLWGLVERGRAGGLSDDVISDEMSLLLDLMLTGTARPIIKSNTRLGADG